MACNTSFLRVIVDIIYRGEQITAIFNRFAVEAILKDMAGAVVLCVKIDSIAREQSLNNVRYFIACVEKQMNMIVHQAIGQRVKTFGILVILQLFQKIVIIT